MHDDPKLPNSMPELAEPIRFFLAGVREDEIPNLKLLAGLREDEREALRFVIERFSIDDLKVISESLESLRTMKRFGKFGMWFMGAIIAGAGAAAALKTLFSVGAPK